MIEVLAGAAAILTVLLVVAVFYAVTYRMERDEALGDFRAECGLNRHYENRITNMRADIQTLEKALETMRTSHDRLVDERDQLKRQIGRMEAEARAEKLSAPAKHPDGHIAFTPARDDKGKFLPKPKPPKPPKAAKKPKPLSCG